MPKTATQVLQDAIFSSICDAVEAFKANSGGMPNVLIRDLNTVHSNTVMESLPDAVQKSIRESVQGTLKRLQREGYVVSQPSLVQKPKSRK